jgi:serine/threonine protein kinase
LSEEFPVQLAGLSEGSRLARYRIEVPLGAGGMAVVYRAHDERLKRLVALKVFAPIAAGDRFARQRFINESRAAAAVDHEHIIPIYEADEARGFLFIAMRLVRGGDLRGLLEREGILSPARAAGIISQVASALDAAHGAGLVHRDVKPANILLAELAGESDYVYLSDFGVSKQATRLTTLTGTGQFLGTPDYAAPEQGRDVPLDGRADQYALACVAHHLLTGAPPFEREGPSAVLMAHLSEPPPSVRERRPELREAVDRVLARALAKVPEKRYGSCREFADALRGALGLVPGWAAVPAGPSTVASADWASAGQPANRSWQATQPGSAPAKGSTLLQPPPPGAVPSRPRRLAANWSWGVMRLGAWGLGILVLAAVAIAGFRLVTHHSPKAGSVSNQSHAAVPAVAGPPVNPAQQPQGVSRDIVRIAAAGTRIVTTGWQQSGSVVHQQFYVSVDGGATWYLAPIQQPGSGRLTAGEQANRIAGGPRGWLAEGPQAIWTSKNGVSWTLAATHGIAPQQAGDSIDVVTATADGFLAAGGTGNQAVIWVSRDGTTWQRLTATQLGLNAAGVIQYATSRGNDTLISDGSGVWLSTDGGTSWTRVTVPAGDGASDGVSGLSFDDSGLIVVRPGTGASGAPGGVAYFSPNGQAWQFAGLIDPTGGWKPALVKGSDYGIVVVGPTASGQNVAYASTGTGATWRPTKSLGAPDATINSATVGSGDTVIAVGSAGQHVVFIKTIPGALALGAAG